MQKLRFDFNSKIVRVVMINNEPWWVLVDVCNVLGIVNSRDVSNRLDDDEKDYVDLTDAIGRRRDTTVINEPGLYSVILRSDKPEAKKFKRWITHEVLPAIRQQGMYIAPTANDSGTPMEIPDGKDWLTAARLVAHCPKERLNLVLKMLRKGGFEVEEDNSHGTFTTADTSERIAEAVRVTGMNAYTIATKLGYSSSTFSNWCTKQRFPRPAAYEKLCAELDALMADALEA